MFKYSEEYSHPTCVCLNVTDNCNLACRYCAPAGTKILMADWSEKNIEDIQPNDEVISCEEFVEPHILKTKVIDVMNRQTDTLYKITLSDDGKEILLTPNHPVLDGKRTWTEVKNLTKQDAIMALSGSNMAEAFLFKNEISNIEIIKGDFTVYNFETESHTYIANSLAVHNCFVQQNPHYMSLDVALKAVDWVMENKRWKDEHNVKDTPPGITFFGGEPTLMWDQIVVPTVNYIKEKYKDENIGVGITTNGTLLNKERMKFIKDNNMNLLLSIDGPKEVQDFNRPTKNGESSYDLVAKNIGTLLEDHPYLTFRSTIYQSTVSHLYETYYFAQEIGFNSIFMCPNARDSWTDEQLETLKQEINKIYIDRIMHYLSGVKPIGCSQIDAAFMQIFEHDMSNYVPHYTKIGQEREPMRCGLGSTSASVAYDGKIFACQEQDSRPTSDIFYIGDIYNGIDPIKHNKILSTYATDTLITCAEDPSLCKTCKSRLSCHNSTCPSTSWDNYNDFFKKPIVDCRLTQWLVEGALHCMHLLVDREQNELFKEYLNNLYKMEEK